MTITNIMHVTGSKADLYSPSYFKKVEGERPAINPFERWVDGELFAFGTRTDELGTSRVVINLTTAKDAVPITVTSDDPFADIQQCINDNEAIAALHLVVNPVIPPSRSYTSWKYRSLTEEHQFSRWVGNQWVPTTDKEVLYYKDAKNNEFLDRKVTEDTVAQPYKCYYYTNKWDYPIPYQITIDCKPGADLTAIAVGLKQHFLDKYTISEEEAEITITEVDITQAEYYDCDSEKEDSLMGFWLGQLKIHPKMISVDQNVNVIASYGSRNEINMDGDFEYRHSLPDAVFDCKKSLFKKDTTLPICNGLVCYPRVIDNKLYASQGQRLSYNKADRNRRWVLVDFNPVGGATFVHLSKFDGPLSAMEIPTNEEGIPIIDTSKQSALLVIRGRLFTPDEFEIINNRYLLFDRTRYTAIHELDRAVCRGDFRWNSKIIEPRKYTVDTTTNTKKSTISFFKKTEDTTFQDNKQYFVEFNGDFVAVDVTPYLGSQIAQDKAYVFGKDTDNVYKSRVHGEDGDLLFNEFYERSSVVITTPETEVVVEGHVPERKTDVVVEAHESDLDLKNDDNSFLVIINRPGLEIIRHRCFEGPWPITKMKWGTDAKTGTMKVDFDKQVRGLLFDEQSKSVIDYTRETQTLTFYADKFRKWGIANVSANWSSLLAICDESSHNSIVSRGFVLDRCRIDKYDHVVWPKLSVLDFIFRD